MSEVKKVQVHLQAVANAPILKHKTFNVDSNRDIAWFTLTIRKIMNLPADQNLFFYISQTFAPSPDHTFGVLRDCYAVKDCVNLQYSTTHAWG
ncbi:unnamed protein product [Caenorhabditis angaria]|uniref:Ubiquitin-like protein ATG12 n=1 Tax=Caenorhabditis angaria TaxID=860376 RepID=A0A9P1IJE3_9PELO|nr:unnamed protein product [Caenorhabditis angaria]